MILSDGQKKAAQPLLKHHQTLRALARFSQMRLIMAASVLLGVLLGKHLDDLTGASPWLLLLFSFLGVGAAIRSLLKMPGRKEEQFENG